MGEIGVADRLRPERVRDTIFHLLACVRLLQAIDGPSFDVIAIGANVGSERMIPR